jgi:hypothetical protein
MLIAKTLKPVISLLFLKVMFNIRARAITPFRHNSGSPKIMRLLAA